MEAFYHLKTNRLLDTLSSLDEPNSSFLLAVREWESGLWIQAHPSPYISTLLGNTTFRLATCLCLVAHCFSSRFCHCEEAVDSLGHHDLSCYRSPGRTSRHANINDTICCAPPVLKLYVHQMVCVRDDGKRPYSLSLLSWNMGRH